MRDKEDNPTKEQLRFMADEEVNFWCAKFRGDVVSIQSQIENWSQGLTPEEWDDEWRDKAGIALSVKLDQLNMARAEAAVRHSRNKRFPKKKPATSKHAAFAFAAKDILSKEVCNKIWDAAREKYPDLFPDDK